MDKFFADWVKTAKTVKFKGLENLALYSIQTQWKFAIQVLETLKVELALSTEANWLSSVSYINSLNWRVTAPNPATTNTAQSALVTPRCDHTHLDVIVEEVRLEVVDTELQCPEALVDEGLGAIQSRDQWVHEHVEVREERAESHRHRQTQLHKQVLHVLLVLATLQPVQTCTHTHHTLAL